MNALPKDWPIAGTTGYDFLNHVLRLFIDPQGEAPLTEFYAEFTGESTDFAALAREKKHLVMRDLFASDINRLTAQLAEICEDRRRLPRLHPPRDELNAPRGASPA